MIRSDNMDETCFFFYVDERGVLSRARCNIKHDIMFIDSRVAARCRDEMAMSDAGQRRPFGGPLKLH